MKFKYIFFGLAIVVAFLVTVNYVFRNADLISFTDDFSKLTDELVVKVNSDDLSELDNAQRLLDERKAGFGERYSVIKKNMEKDSDDEDRLLNNLETNSAKFALALTSKFKGNSGFKQNPEINKKLQKLIGDYRSILK